MSDINDEEKTKEEKEKEELYKNSQKLIKVFGNEKDKKRFDGDYER